MEKELAVTVHSKMFDQDKSQMTKHRIYVEFEGGYFVTSLDPSFHVVLQRMVEDLGPPTKVEFRREDEGWVRGTFES